MHADLALKAKYVAEIVKRGGEIKIEGRYEITRLQLTDEDDGLALMACEGWRQYSRQFGARRASLAYLCGVDDNGTWAVRVPGTIQSVKAAVEWVEPIEVRQARAKGVKVKRQGDVYAVQSKRDRAADDATKLPEAHVWNPTARTLKHNPEDGRKHKLLRVPYPARFFEQRVYQMGRGVGQRGCGD